MRSYSDAWLIKLKTGGKKQNPENVLISNYSKFECIILLDSIIAHSLVLLCMLGDYSLVDISVYDYLCANTFALEIVH